MRRTKLTISLCMIALNEEEFIGRALKNVKPYVDEIVVVDGGSKDRTVKIAERHGAKVIHAPWRHHFARQRNIGLRHATGDWILQMDPDESYTKPFLKNLRQWVSNTSGIDAFAFVEKHYIDGKLSTTTKQVKLFKRSPDIRFRSEVHEKPFGFKMLAVPSRAYIQHWKTSARQRRQSEYYMRFVEHRHRVKEGRAAKGHGALKSRGDKIP